MPARRIHVAPAEALRQGFEAIRDEAGVVEQFAAEALSEAEQSAARAGAAAGSAAEREGTHAAGDRERLDLPFVTIDPPGSRDLDQALHIERSGRGHVVHYAIADVAAFVAPGRGLDAAAHQRGVTVYSPDAKAPLYPPVLSDGAASLLPGQWRPAVLWTLELEERGELVSTDVRRAEVRSRAQHTYADVPSELEPLLREVGERRLALERARGGVRLTVPEQEVVNDGGSWSVRYRVPHPSEDHNAQVSLMTGMAAAALMLRAGTGILRTQARPEPRALERLRHQAKALKVHWPAELSYPDFIARLDPALPAHAALMQEATGVGRGAGYTAFDGAPPDEQWHFAVAAPYAHATAPLRRLQDRYVSESCLAAAAGTSVPAWVRAGLAALPDAMKAGVRRANAVERGAVDLVEAMLLKGREGERFDAVVIDEDLIQLREPAVRGRLEGAAPEPGSEISATLTRADPAARIVLFAAQ